MCAATLIPSVKVVRSVALGLVVSIAGLSSSFAFCVSACTDEAATATSSHTCHGDVGDISVAADVGACPHSPAVVRAPDLSREDRVSLVFAEPVVANLRTDPAIVAGASAPRASRTPVRPSTSHTVLRI